MPILPTLTTLFAGLLTLNAGHYWYHELKPFKSEEEYVQVFKEELAESTFTALLSKEYKDRLVKDEDFMILTLIEPISVQTGQDQYIFAMGRTTTPEEKNRYEVRKELNKNASALGHEGAHIAQGLANLGNANQVRAQVREDHDTYQYLTLDTPTYLSKDPDFMKPIHDVNQKIKNYNENPDKSSRFEIYTKLIDIHRNFEKDCDNQGFNAVVTSNTLTSKQKLAALLTYNKYYDEKTCKSKHTEDNNQLTCQSFDFTHPACKERIAIFEPYIQSARADVFNDDLCEINWR